MQIEISSVIIGLASLATFAVPIGYDQYKVKRAESRAKKQFLDTSANVGFQYDSYDILGNSAVIGIGKNGEDLLYMKNDTEHSLIEMRNLTSCRPYESQEKIVAEDGSHRNMKEVGIRLTVSETRVIKLPVFEGRDGTQRGNESIVVEKWISRINSSLKTLHQGIS